MGKVLVPLRKKRKRGGGSSQPLSGVGRSPVFMKTSSPVPSCSRTFVFEGELPFSSLFCGERGREGRVDGRAVDFLTLVAALRRAELCQLTKRKCKEGRLVCGPSTEYRGSVKRKYSWLCGVFFPRSLFCCANSCLWGKTFLLSAIFVLREKRGREGSTGGPSPF